MDQLIVKNTTNLAEYMLETASYGKNVTVALSFYDAVDLIGELVTYKDVQIGDIKITAQDYLEYSAVYYVTINSGNTLSVERICKNSLYLNHEPNLLLLHENESSRNIGDSDQTEYKKLHISNRHYWAYNCPSDCCCDCSNCKNISS